MNSEVKVKHLIYIALALFALFYVWSIGLFDFGPHKPSVIHNTDTSKAIEADHKWVNGVQIY